MTVAVSAAKAEGPRPVVCASTGNTAASCRLRSAWGHARRGDRARGQDRHRQAGPGADARRCVIALRGNFDEALALVRELAQRHPIALVNSVNDYRVEGQKTGAFEVCDELGEPPDVLCIPVGNAGNVTSWWKGFQEPTPLRACTATRPRAPRRRHGGPVEAPGDRGLAIRIGNPARWEDAMNAFTASRGEVRAVSDAEILDAYAMLGAREGVLRAGVGGLGGGAAALRRRGPRGVCLTGHGLKDPQTAMNRAASVVPCEPDIDSVERAVPG